VFDAWQGYSFYTDPFDTDDVLLRAAFFAAMLAIAPMGVLIGDCSPRPPRGRREAHPTEMMPRMP